MERIGDANEEIEYICKKVWAPNNIHRDEANIAKSGPQSTVLPFG